MQTSKQHQHSIAHGISMCKIALNLEAVFFYLRGSWKLMGVYSHMVSYVVCDCPCLGKEQRL